MKMRRKGISCILACLAAVCLLFGGALTGYAAPEPVQIGLEDGEYTVDVVLEGGSGKAAVTSPAVLLVRDGRAYARIEWSSSHYDYMKVGEEKYLPINEEGNSVFEIPVTAWDEPMEVIGDTTAMSVPHEIEYTLTFSADSVAGGSSTSRAGSGRMVYIAVGVVVLAVCVLIFLRLRKRGDSGK